MSQVLFLQIIYYGSYVVAAFLLWKFLKRLRAGKILGILFWGLFSGLFIRARFIEPQQINVQETRLDVGFEKNIVLLADLHLGVYKSSDYLQRVINKINSLENIDAVVIAGDLTNEPVDISQKALTEVFVPLSQSIYPVYAVLGNHDVEIPGPDLRRNLIEALTSNNVTFLHNDIVRLDQVYLAGLGPHLAGEDNIQILDVFEESDDLVVLTHNPDTIIGYDTQKIADVTLVGHTHCGQIRFERLPALYKRAIPTVGDFDCGIYNDLYTKLYITPGLGEVVLPMRFLNPPTIDVLRLR